MLDEEIFCYIGRRVDFDNVLPCMDDIYTEFQHYFEVCGYNTDVIERMIDSYVSCSDLEGVNIEWEDEIKYESSHRRVTESTQLPPKTA